MNITLAIDETTAIEARAASEKMGKSLNQAVRDYLTQLAGTHRAEANFAEFTALCLASAGRRNGWQFDRDEANAR